MDDDDAFILENNCLKLFLMESDREYWVNQIYETRDINGEFVSEFPHLLAQPKKFFEYFRMMPDTFNYILARIQDRLTKHSNFRKCIEPVEKLAVTLRFLSTGMAFRSLAFSFKMAHTTVRNVVYETCTAIWEEFNMKHMPFPTTTMLSECAEEFYKKWNFPNCFGCIDGKHIRLKCSANPASMNYKQYHSIVLQGIADANYKFICIDVDSYGKQSDRLFSKCTLFQHLEKKTFIPPERCLPGTELKLPHVLLGDQAYPLKEYMMRPYSRRELSAEEVVFNYRLSNACRTGKYAFRMLLAKWKILKKEIEVHPDNAVSIVKCISLLHNIVIDMEGLPEELLRENGVSLECNRHKVGRQHNRATQAAYKIRDSFKQYFCTVEFTTHD